MVEFRDLSPLYELSAIFGLRPVQLFRREPSVIYSYFIYFPLSAFIVGAKILDVTTEWISDERTSIGIILLLLNLVMGIPDICCILIHVHRLRKEGAVLMAHFDAVHPKKCPKLYHKFLVPVGFLAYIFTIIAWCSTYKFDLLGSICNSTINLASYLILMQFCTYLDLNKEMVAFRDLSPLYQLSGIFGLRPTRLFRKEPSVIYSYFIYLPISTFFIVSKVLEVVTEWNSADRTSIHIILLVLYLVMGIPDICCILIHVHRLRKEGAVLMAHFGAVHPKKCPTLYHRFLVSVGIVVYFSLNIAWCSTYGFEVMENMCKATINVASYLILMQLCSYLDLIKAKMIEGFPVDSGAILETVSNHLELLKKAGWANRYFSRQLLVLCIRIMMNSIIKIYYLLYFISLSNRSVSIVLVATLGWEFFLLGVLTRCCNSVSKVGLEFNKKLFKIIRKDKDLCNNEKLKLYVLMKPGITFTACGFFNIGYPLVTSIIAAAMTYLVILVQFSNT